jgi:hypothetical protein
MFISGERSKSYQNETLRGAKNSFAEFLKKNRKEKGLDAHASIGLKGQGINLLINKINIKMQKIKYMFNILG